MLMDFIGRLYRNTDLLDNPGDYERLAEEIELFSVSSQIYYLLTESGRAEKTTDRFRQRMKAKYEKVLYQNMLLKHESDSLLRLFESNEIPVITLKGTRFAERYFGHFAARGTSDIDILVEPADLKRAIDCVKKAGFTGNKEERRSNNHCSYTKHTQHATFTLSVEVHWSLEKDYASDLDHGRIWKQSEAVPGFHYVRELSPEDTFYYICLHGARHQMDSVKYFIDIVQLIYRIGDTLDYSRLLNAAARDKTKHRLLYVLQTVYRQFPHLHEVKPLPTKRGFRLWSYKQIRAVLTGQKSFAYYAYHLHLRLFGVTAIYDTWKHRLMSIPFYSFILPPTAYIVYMLDIDNAGNYNRLQLYRILYKNRYKRLFSRFSKRYQKEASHVHDVRSDRRASG